MEVALMQAKKSCPFIHLTSNSTLKRLSANAASTGNGLLRKAQQCPVMSQAMGQQHQARAISTSSVAAQAPSKVAKAEGKRTKSQINQILEAS
jgi:5-aminolevulinate synthase